MPIFHFITFEPSKGGKGSILKPARKMLKMPTNGTTVLTMLKSTNNNTNIQIVPIIMFMKGPAALIFPFCSLLVLPLI